MTTNDDEFLKQMSAINAFDELEANKAEEEKDDFESVFFLKKEEIAKLAYESSISLRTRVKEFEEDAEIIKTWDDMSESERAEYVQIADVAMKNKDSDDEFGRAIYSRRAMRYLSDGWSFAETHDAAEKKTHYVAPWEAIPAEKRAPLLLFKATVNVLKTCWDHDASKMFKQ
jgi:hypothetical protein